MTDCWLHHISSLFFFVNDKVLIYNIVIRTGQKLKRYKRICKDNFDRLNMIGPERTNRALIGCDSNNETQHGDE